MRTLFNILVGKKVNRFPYYSVRFDVLRMESEY